MAAGLVRGLVGPALLTPGPLGALTLGPESPPTACFTASPLAALCTVTPLMPFGDLCDFLNERKCNYFLQAKASLTGLQAYEGPALPGIPARSHSLRALGPQVTYNGLFSPLPGVPDAWRSV